MQRRTVVAAQLVARPLVAAVVAAMGQHTADAVLQRYGCGALHNLTFGDAACERAVVVLRTTVGGGMSKW